MYLKGVQYEKTDVTTAKPTTKAFKGCAVGFLHPECQNDTQFKILRLISFGKVEQVSRYYYDFIN